MLSDWASLDDDDREHMDRVFADRIFPVLTPLAVDPGHPFPYISSMSLNLAVILRNPASGERRFARVKVPPILPPFVAASATGPDRVRTLVLRQDAGTLSYTILRAADPVPGEPELAETAASRNAMENVVASLPAAGSGDAGDTGRALSQFGIGYVLLPDPGEAALASQLNAAAGLQPLTRSSAYDLWQVSGTVARVRALSTIRSCPASGTRRSATTRAARIGRSTRDAKPDQLLRFPALAGRRDFDDVLAWRKPSQRQLDLLIELRRRRRR